MTPTDNLEAGAGDETARADFNAEVADFHDALAQQWHTKYLEAAAQLSAVTAENARLREAAQEARDMVWPMEMTDRVKAVLRILDAALSQEAPK